MLNIFIRRKRRSNGVDGDPLAIRDLLDHPALRAAMTPEAPDTPASLDWARLLASGPIRFDVPLILDHAA